MKSFRKGSITNGLPFSAKKEEILDRFSSNPKFYTKFYSEPFEETKGYKEYFIPAENYERIKKYLIKLNQVEAKKNKSRESDFVISYSSVITLISFEPSIIDHQFVWADEIKQTPYFSSHDLLLQLMSKNQALMTDVMFGYVYSFKLLKGNFLLTKIINDLKLTPKSILPLIEKSLKSGNKEFCSVVKNPEEPIAADQLNLKQRKMLNVLKKYCPTARQIRIKP